MCLSVTKRICKLLFFSLAALGLFRLMSGSALEHKCDRCAMRKGASAGWIDHRCDRLLPVCLIALQRNYSAIDCTGRECFSETATDLKNNQFFSFSFFSFFSFLVRYAETNTITSKLQKGKIKQKC
jgi:hypothetical protein